MEQDIYLIREYKLIDATLYTHELLSIDEVISINEDMGKIKSVEVVQDERKIVYTSNNYFTLSKTGKGYSYNDEYLPYTAKVVEDLPTSCKGLTPKVYEGCKLMSEKHGGYLQFFHPATNQVLIIAMNSHYYEPDN